MKTVRELIKELMDFEMESEIKLTIKYADLDDEFENFSLEEEHAFIGTNKVHIVVNNEDQDYHERFELLEEE